LSTLTGFLIDNFIHEPILKLSCYLQSETEPQ